MSTQLTRLIEGRPEHIDVTQRAGSGESAKIKAWQSWATRHLSQMRVARKAGLFIKEWRNVQEHLLVVNATAVFIARNLNQAGVEIDLNLVDQGSLLHDMAKRRDKEGGVSYGTKHGLSAIRDVLTQAGYPDEVITVAEHAGRVPDMFISDPQARQAAIAATPVEKLVVAYSDARVSGTEIVSLEEARDKNKQKVPADAAIYDQWYAYYYDVQDRLFSLMRGSGGGELTPQDVSNQAVFDMVQSYG